MLEELDDARYAAAIAREKGVTLIEFSAPGCAPCEAIGPVIERLAGAQGENLHAYRLDIAEHPDPAIDAGVRSVPTIILYKAGAAVRTFVGAPGQAELADGIREQLDG